LRRKSGPSYPRLEIFFLTVTFFKNRLRVAVNRPALGAKLLQGGNVRGERFTPSPWAPG
jgi:hypothetical protein